MHDTRASLLKKCKAEPSQAQVIAFCTRYICEKIAQHLGSGGAAAAVAGGPAQDVVGKKIASLNSAVVRLLCLCFCLSFSLSPLAIYRTHLALVLLSGLRLGLWTSGKPTTMSRHHISPQSSLLQPFIHRTSRPSIQEHRTRGISNGQPLHSLPRFLTSLANSARFHCLALICFPLIDHISP